MAWDISSAFVLLIIAKKMKVKAGQGWYTTWGRTWASYSRMIATIIVCTAFNLVTKLSEIIKRLMLTLRPWQAP